MVKALSFFTRKTGMPVDEFQQYWRTRHPEAVLGLPGIRRYVQSHTLLSGYRTREPVYDGVAELWFMDGRGRGTAQAWRPSAVSRSGVGTPSASQPRRA